MSIRIKAFLVFLILVAAGTGIYSHKLNKISHEITPITAPKIEKNEKQNLISTIYYPNSQKNRLVTSEITINSSLNTKEDILTNITTQLIKKLEDEKILKEGKYKFEVYSKNRDLYLDLDSKILLSATTPQEELLIIYSFVNSLLSPGGSDKVILLVNGNPAQKINFINISKYYRKNSDI